MSARARLAVLTVGSILAGSVVLFAPPAGAWTEGACQDATGVTVVVDFQELGGGVNVRCAPGPVTSGFDALDKAGINYQTTIKFPGFLCKIAGRPTNDPCQTASPATTYWSYWLAARGGSWCYSNWGAGSRTPPPGSVEGWSFSLGKDGSTSPSPRFAVPAAVPGTTPSGLSGNDCDPRTDTPTPAPDAATGGTGAPATPGALDPVPPSGSGGAAAPPAGGAVDPGAGTGAGASDGTGGSAGPDGSGAATTVPGAPDGSTTTIAAAAVGEVPTSGPTTTTTSLTDARSTRSEESGTVDLGDGGSSGGGSPLGVLLALTLSAALGGGAFYVRRRATRP